MTPDFVNAAITAGGGCFIWLNVWRLHVDKRIKGVHWLPVLYFTTLGYWHLYYYPFLKQWASFAAGISIVLANTTWLCQILYYRRKERNIAKATDARPTQHD